MAEKRLTDYQRVQLKSKQADSLPIVKEIFVKRGEKQKSTSRRLKLQDNSIMHLQEGQASGLGTIWMAILHNGDRHMYLCSTLENRQKLTLNEVQSLVWEKQRVLLNGIAQECIVAINLSDLHIARNTEDEKDREALQEQLNQQIVAKETAQESKTDREKERYMENAKDEPKVSNAPIEDETDDSDDEDVEDSDSEDKNKALVEKAISILQKKLTNSTFIFEIRAEIKKKLENHSLDFEDILEVFVEGSSKLVLDWKKVNNLDDLIKLIHISIKEKTISSAYYHDNIVLYNRFNRLIESVTKLDEQPFYFLCFKIMLIYGLDIGHICDIFDFISPSQVNSTVLKILKTMRNRKSKNTWFTEYVKKPWIIQNMEVYNDDIDLDQLVDLPWTIPTYTLFNYHFIEKDTKSLMSIIEGISDTFYTSLSQVEVMNNLVAPGIDKKLAVGVSGIQKRLRGCRSLFNDFHCGEFFQNIRHIILNPEDSKREELVESVVELFYITFAKQLDLQKNVARTICAVFCQSLLFEATETHTRSFLNFDLKHLRGLSKLMILGNYQTSFVNEVFTANKEEQTSIEKCAENVREEYRYHFEKDNELIYKLFIELPKKTNLNNMTKQELETWKKGVFVKEGKEYTDASYIKGGLNAQKDKFDEHVMIVRILQSMAATIPKFSLRRVQLATLILFLFYKDKLVSSTKTPTKGILGQVYTGEGKTALVAMIAAYHVLNENKVDIITSSEELIDEPLRNFSRFYAGLGIMAAALKQSTKLPENVYVVYGTVQDFIGEQLRKQKTHPNSEICFPNRIVVVDEVDNMLYDRISSMVQLTGEETSILTPLVYPVLFEIYFRIRECYVDFELTEGENESSEQQLLKALEGEFYTNEELKPKYMEQLESLPEYLKQYCCLQYRSWISNCYKSILRYSNKESYHKDKKTGENIKIDASNTGVLQRNTHLADGLQQFLSLKENTLVDPLSLTASFASISSYIHKYNEVYGLTGTLGDDSTKDFFRDQYKVATVAIPSNFLSRLCVPEKNLNNGYRCYEYKPMCLSKRQDWVGAIVASVEQHITLNRPVLIICQSPLILEKTLEPAIRKMLERTTETEIRFEKPKIKKYSALTKLETTDLLANDILIATNIAGRGIDLRVTNKEVLKNGGLHVCLTYLPKTLRVERQCIGRTARAGQPGTGQLIIFDRDENKTVDDLKNDRKQDIERQITIAKDLIERNTKAEECSATFRTELSRRFEEVYEAEIKIEELNSRPSQKKTKRMIAKDARLAKTRSELSMYQQKWAYWMQGHVFSRSTATEEIVGNHEKFMDRLFNKKENVLAKEHYCFVAIEAFELLKQNSYRETTLFDDFDEVYDLAEEKKIGLQHAGIAFYYYAGYLAQQEKPKDILKQLSKIKFFLQKSKEYIDEVIVHHFKTICEGIMNDGLIFNQMDGVYQIFDDLSRRIGRNISRVAELIEDGNPNIQTKCVVTDLVDVGAITRLTMDSKYNNTTEVFLGSSIFKHCRVFGLVGLLNFDDEERRNRRRFIPVSLTNIFYRQVLMRIYLRAQALRQVLDVRQKPRAVEGVIPQKYQQNNIYTCISLGRNLKYECFLEQKEAEPSDLRKVHRELFRLNMGLISYSGNRDARKLFFEYRTRGGIQRNGWLNSTANLDEIELPEFMKEFEDEVQDIIQDLKDYYEKSFGQDHHQKMVNGFHKHLTDMFECAFQLDVLNGNKEHEDRLINYLKKKLEKKNSILKGFLGEVENAKGNKAKHIKQYRKGIKNAFNKKLIKIWNERKQFLEDINNFDEDKIKQVEQRLNDFFVILANPIDELALGDQDDDTTYQEAMYNVRVKVSSRLAEQSKETKEITCLCCDKSYPLEQRLQNVSETFKIAVVYVHAPIKTRIFFPTRGRIVEAVRICRSTDRKGKRKWYIGRTATSCLYRALSLNYTMQEIETDLIKDTSLQMDRLESDKTESNEIVPWYRLLDQSDQAQIWMRSLDSDPPSKLMKEYYQRLPGMHMIELDIEVD